MVYAHVNAYTHHSRRFIKTCIKILAISGLSLLNIKKIFFLMREFFCINSLYIIKTYFDGLV